MKKLLLIATMCSFATGALLPEEAAAMLPVGNDAHRHFYKDQEWIWTTPQKTAVSVGPNLHSAPAPTLAFTMSTNPPQTGLAFTMPTHPPQGGLAFTMPDRKSTRLNSSHTVISYAVFCLHRHRVRLTYTIASHHPAQGHAAVVWDGIL